MGASSTDAISVAGLGGARPHGLSRARLAWVLATSRRRWAVSVWLCLIVALAVPALEPLLEVVAAQSAVAQVVTQHGSLIVEWSAADAGTFSAIQRRVETTVAARMGSQLTLIGASTRSGPFLEVTPEGRAARVLPGNQGLTPTYLDHLASHVSVVAGELPPDGLGGGDTAVTMTQAAADQLGLRVNDRFCMEAAGTQPPSWCARLVGLWEPADPHDLYWGNTPPHWQLAMGRYDFFRMMSQRPPHQAVASLRFWAKSAEIDAGEATAVARQVQDLSGALRRSGLRVVTSLDRSLERFAASQRATSHASRLVAATVAMLGLLVAALATVRLLGEQSRELGVLRARGWSRRGTWQLASAGPVTLVALALPVAMAASVAITAASAAPSGITLYAPHLWDLAGPAAVFMANAVGLIVVMAWSAAWAASWDAEPSRQHPLRDRRTGPWETAVTVLFATAGCCAVALPGLPGLDRPDSRSLAGLLDPVATMPAVGLVLLAVAIARLRPFQAFAAQYRGSVPELLAARQLERRPQQHVGIALVLVLCAAIEVFAGAALLALQLWGASGPPTVRAGAEVGLLVGALGAVALALGAFALHSRWASRRGLGEYGGLFAHGLRPPQVARSLAAEQRAIAWSSLLAGGLLGAALTIAAPPMARTSFEFAALGAIALLVGLLAVAPIAGQSARRLLTRANQLAGRER